jgi:pimeloyl-ACP methyl ester carboxylesterase
MRKQLIRNIGIAVAVLAAAPLIFTVVTTPRPAELKDGRSRVLSEAFNEMAIGSADSRSDGFDPRKAQLEAAKTAETAADPWNNPEAFAFKECVIGDIRTETEFGDLSGYIYRPADDSLAIPKLVIFFSGTGGSNASMIGGAAAQYCRLGATVIGVDYRGFGENGKMASELTEAELYADAKMIFKFSCDTLRYMPEDIILHGFSLGGAVASWLAADLAEADVYVGGLVLHSSILTMTDAAAGTLSLPKPLADLGGWVGGRLTGGAYDTVSHLKRLAAVYGDIPLHFIGGDTTSGDTLSLEVTRINGLSGFSDTSVYNGSEGHQIPDSKQAANMTEDLRVCVN